MKKYISIVTALSLLTFVGCSSSESNATIDETITTTTTTASTTTQSQLLTFPSYDYTQTLSDSTHFSDGDEILITQSGTYEFSGEYINSMITVNVNKDTDDGIVYLILNNASFLSETQTPINIIEAQDVVIILEGENSVYQGEIITTDTEFPSGAIYSKADTVITGDGSITVTTLYQDGINSRDDLIIDSTNINITAVEDGVIGKDLLAISESNITVDAKKDGLKSSNSEDLDKGNLLIVSGEFNITAQNDAISSDNILQIDDGDFNLSSGGGYTGVIKTPSSGGMGGGMPGGMSGGRGEANFSPESFDETALNQENFIIDDENDELILDESMKGIKAATDLIINGGTFNISSYEDAIHSDSNVTINSGNFIINAGDDAIHANNTTNIYNGTINIENCFEGIEGIFVNISGGDIFINTDDDGINANDRSGGVTISGGNIEILFGAGGDGIDSNGTFTQTGGDIVITSPENSDAMNAPLDVDGTVTMTGGTIVDENGNDIEATGIGNMGANQGGMRPNGGGMPEDFEDGMRPSDGDMPEDFDNNNSN